MFYLKACNELHDWTRAHDMDDFASSMHLTPYWTLLTVSTRPVASITVAFVKKLT